MPTVRSHWLIEALQEDAGVCAALAGAERADVAVLGGGYCGLWTAIELKSREPAMDIVLIERDICGGGASGRNAGYVMDLWAKFLALRALFGDTEALRICRAAALSIGEIEVFCRSHGIDAHFENAGWIWGATCRRHATAWTGTIRALDSLGEAPFSDVPLSELHDRYGLRGHVAAVRQSTVGRVQPAHLVRGMRRAALKMGVRIFEQSRVTGLTPGKTCVAASKKGTVTAPNVVIAMNAWGTVFPEIRRGIAVTGAEGCVTLPVPALVKRLDWTYGPSITDSRRMIVNYRATRDGRIEMGKGGGVLAYGNRIGNVFEGPALRARQIMCEVVSAVPDLAEVTIDRSWMGPIDKSYHGVPAAARLGANENIFYGCGFSGNGVGPSKLIAKILASLVLRRNDEWSSLGLAGPLQGSFPREPIRYVGGQIVRAAVERHDRLDNKDKEADSLTKWLVAQMPGALIPQKAFER